MEISAESLIRNFSTKSDLFELRNNKSLVNYNNFEQKLRNRLALIYALESCNQEIPTRLALWAGFIKHDCGIFEKHFLSFIEAKVSGADKIVSCSMRFAFIL